MYFFQVAEKTAGHFLDRPIFWFNVIKIFEFKYKMGTIIKEINSLSNGMSKNLKTMFKS
jgi:hypothetical protein